MDVRSLQQTKVISGQTWIDYIELVMQENSPLAKANVEQLRKAYPGMNCGDLANKVLFSVFLNTSINALNVGAFRELPLVKGIIEANFFPCETLNLIHKQIYIILHMTEIFQTVVKDKPMAGIILLLLSEESNSGEKGSLDKADLNEMVDFLGKCFMGKLAENVFGLLKRQLAWKHMNTSFQGQHAAPMLSAHNFMYLRNIGLAAKYLFQHGRISGEEEKNFKKVSENILKVVMRTLLTMARAAGNITQDKKDFIRNYCELYNLDMPIVEFHSDNENDLGELLKALTTVDQKLFFYSFISDLILMSEKTEEAQMKLLRSIDDALKIPMA